MFNFIGSLPRGDWRFYTFDGRDGKPLLLLIDRSGSNQPYVVVDDKLVLL